VKLHVGQVALDETHDALGVIERQSPTPGSPVVHDVHGVARDPELIERPLTSLAKRSTVSANLLRVPLAGSLDQRVRQRRTVNVVARAAIG